MQSQHLYKYFCTLKYSTNGLLTILTTATQLYQRLTKLLSPETKAINLLPSDAHEACEDICKGCVTTCKNSQNITCPKMTLLTLVCLSPLGHLLGASLYDINIKGVISNKISA